MNSYNHSDFRFRPQRTTLEMPARARQEQPAAKTVSSEALFNGAHEIGIAHAGSLYRLKITRQGKLILNK